MIYNQTQQRQNTRHQKEKYHPQGYSENRIYIYSTEHTITVTSFFLLFIFIYSHTALLHTEKINNRTWKYIYIWWNKKGSWPYIQDEWPRNVFFSIIEMIQWMYEMKRIVKNEKKGRGSHLMKVKCQWDLKYSRKYDEGWRWIFIYQSLSYNGVELDGKQI